MGTLYLPWYSIKSILPFATTNKEVLVDNLWKSMKEEQGKPSGYVEYVLDGGTLLHRVPWPRGSTV